MNGRCEACRAATSGRSDLLCAACWPRVPVALKALFRLVWRLVTAGLVMEGAKLELERIIIREAREARAAAGGPVPGLIAVADVRGFTATTPVRVVPPVVPPSAPAPVAKAPVAKVPVIKATGRKVAVPLASGAVTLEWGEIPPARVVDLRTPPAERPRVAGLKRVTKTTTALIAALPRSSSEAVTAKELAARAGTKDHIAAVWLSSQRGKLPDLGAVRASDGPRVWRYWWAAA